MVDLRATPQPLPRPARWAVFGVFVAFTAAGLGARVGDHLVLALISSTVAIALAAATIFGRGSLTVLTAIGSGVAVTVLAEGEPANLGWFGIVALVGWFTMASSPVIAIGYWAATIVLFTSEAAFVRHDAGWVAWLGGTCFTVLASWFASRQHDLVIQLREAQAGLAARAQTEERNRIARELHDVIAHSLTVSLLHVSAARLALDEDRDEAARALEEAERLGRESLDEVRHAVGLLRRDGEPDPTTPMPGSLDVPALLERFRGAGAHVDSTVDGDLGTLPNTVGLATFRILQEALTNAVKHAPNTTSTVHVAVARDAVRLSVDSSGPPKRGSGLGLLGMRERAESLGGRCDAGPGGSGWLVRAELPLGGAPR
jgi:signal transduction histidine kinase